MNEWVKAEASFECTITVYKGKTMAKIKINCDCIRNDKARRSVHGYSEVGMCDAVVFVFQVM
jgi:hypothetical protein